MSAFVPTNIIVFGASGDLAKKKIYPALYSLFNDNMLHPGTNIIGYSRSVMNCPQFHSHLTPYLRCRLRSPESCSVVQDDFLEKCSYVYGDYDNMSVLRDYLSNQHESKNQLFYLSLPPSMYETVTERIPSMFSQDGWNRVIVEKPFGHDLQSFYDLSAHVNQYVADDDLYRIDHYLGKELVENITTLRFENPVFHALWNRQYIDEVAIRCFEDFGIEGRKYFDQSGILRDIVQNHLLQVLALIAMERPLSENSEHHIREKIKVLRATQIDDRHTILGQYQPYPFQDSNTETYARIKLHVNTDRWKGVPFVIEAGKGMNQRCVEVVIRFKKSYHWQNANALVIRIQPHTGITLRITNKSPGYGHELQEQNMDFTYERSFPDTYIPDAYEKLILDCIRGDQRMFTSFEELEQSWRILDPILYNEQKRITYPFGHPPCI